MMRKGERHFRLHLYNPQLPRLQDPLGSLLLVPCSSQDSTSPKVLATLDPALLCSNLRFLEIVAIPGKDPAAEALSYACNLLVEF